MTKQTELLQRLIEKSIIKKKESTYVFTKGYKQKLFINADLLQQIIEYTIFLQYSASIETRVRCVFQNVFAQPLCQQCNKPLRMRESGKFRFTFALFCSTACTSKNSITKERRSRTNQRLYGSTNVLNSDMGLRKRAETMMSKYGVDNPGKSVELINKRKLTCIERYGYENPTQNATVRAKRKDTTYDRYGVYNVLCAESPFRLLIEQDLLGELPRPKGRGF
jgi:hypothetical protein